MVVLTSKGDGDGESCLQDYLGRRGGVDGAVLGVGAVGAVSVIIIVRRGGVRNGLVILESAVVSR